MTSHVVCFSWNIRSNQNKILSINGLRNLSRQAILFDIGNLAVKNYSTSHKGLGQRVKQVGLQDDNDNILWKEDKVRETLEKPE
jgi:hypothetical protein